MSRVLLADDEPDLRLMLAAVLEAAGHDVVTAANGQEAVEAVDRQLPDLVVLDVSMPVLTGLEALVRIRADHGAEPPVLMLSALSTRADVRAGYVAGADDYLAKPFSSAELIERVRMLLDERAVLA